MGWDSEAKAPLNWLKQVSLSFKWGNIRLCVLPCCVVEGLLGNPSGPYKLGTLFLLSTLALYFLPKMG